MTQLVDRLGRTIDWLRARKTAYQLAFGSPAGGRVLEDLAEFCRAHKSCFDPDPRLHALAEGRREVWLRIIEHLDVPIDQLIRNKVPARLLDSQDD